MGAIAFNLAAAMTATAPPAPPKQEMLGLVKRVWLLLYAEGGRWSAAEIRKRLHLSGDIHAALREMVERGFIVRTVTASPYAESRVQYGVERRCKVPRGVAIAEIEETLAMGLRRP
jgi:hypothetical protein